MRKAFSILLIFLTLTTPVFAQQGQLLQDKVTTVKAKVLDITAEQVKQVPGTDVSDNYQTLQVQILEGDQKGQIVTVNNDYLSLKKGETFYMLVTVRADGSGTLYGVSEPYRLPAVLFFVGLFVVLVIAFGGIQGIRGTGKSYRQFCFNIVCFVAWHFAWVFADFNESRCCLTYHHCRVLRYSWI